MLAGSALFESLIFSLASAAPPHTPSFPRGTVEERMSAELQRHNAAMHLMMVRRP